MVAVAEHIKVPELRFPEFSGEWNGQRLGEFIKVNPPDMPLPNSFYYIDLDAVDKGILKDAEKTSLESAPSRAQRFLEVGDVLFQMVRPYQKNNLWFREKTGEYVASTGYAVLRSKCQSFTYQLLHTPQFNNHVRVRCTGSSYPAINTSELRLIPVQFPSLPEQQKIAEFLTAVDEKIGKLKRKKELLEAYKKGAMQKLFSQEIRFKDDQGNPYPDWEEKRLEEILTAVKDGTHATHSNSDKGEYFLLSAKNIKNSSVVITSNERRIDAETFLAITKTFLPEKGDCLLTIVGTIGEVALMPESANFCFQRSVAFLRPSDAITSEFLFCFLSSQIAQTQYRRRQVTGAQPGLYLQEISRIAMTLPSLPEQQKIAEFLTGIDDKIKAVANQIDKAAEFKKGLLQKMFV